MTFSPLGIPVRRLALPFSFIPVAIAATTGVRRHEAGVASGLLSTAQQIGGATGVAIVSPVWISHFNHLVKRGTPFPQAFTSGVQWAFWVCAGIALAGLVATLTLIRSKDFVRAAEAASLNT